jgi:hypothetical protein
MAIQGGPDIVEDGLVLHLDAADRNSYPLSGNIWYNLAQNNRHYTKYGSVPFSDEVGGCWDFTSMSTGTSYYSPLGFTSTGGIPFGNTSSFTILCWINTNTTQNQEGLFSNAGGGSGFRFGPSNGSVYHLVGDSTSFRNATLGSGGFYSTNQWVLIGAVFDRQGNISGTPYVYGYVNETMVGSQSQVAQGAMTTSTPGIVRSACCNRFTGKLSTLSVYNRALYENEIQQNYNATKGRFGL